MNMGFSVLWISFAVLLLLGGHFNNIVIVNVQAVDLFPFGVDVGDDLFPRSTTSRISVGFSTQIKVAGKVYTALTWTEDGMLAFEGLLIVGEYLAPGKVAVVGLGANVRTWQAGACWRRQTKNPQELKELQTEISRVDESFDASWAFVFTWYEVPGWNLDQALRNSFQVILVADGLREKTYGIFNYNRVEWLQTNYGFEAGFNSGVPETTLSLRGDMGEEEFQDFLLSKSNVGIPGKFILRIDGDSCVANLHPQLSINKGEWMSGNTSANMAFIPDSEDTATLTVNADPNSWTHRGLTMECTLKVRGEEEEVLLLSGSGNGILPTSLGFSLGVDDRKMESCTCTARSTGWECVSSVTIRRIPADVSTTQVPGCSNSPGFLYPHSDNCSLYKSCDVGIEVVHACRDDKVFSPLVSACVEFNSLLDTCTRKDVVKACTVHPRAVGALLPDSSSCDIYWECDSTRTLVQRRCFDSFFDVMDKRCMSTKDANCGNYVRYEPKNNIGG